MRKLSVKKASTRNSDQFADNLASARLSKKERQAWASDLRKARKHLRGIEDIVSGKLKGLAQKQFRDALR
jgi:hypothetical protein